MPAAEREILPEHQELNPPVIPAFMTLPRRSGRMSGPVPQSGWEGFKIVRDEETGAWKAKKTQDFVLYVMADGYCEIPATKANIAKFKTLSETIVHHKMKMVKETTPDQRVIEVPARDGNGKIVYTDEVERTEPPLFRRAKGRRSFDAVRNSVVDLVRPWLRQFVNVPDAILEPETVAE